MKPTTTYLRNFCVFLMGAAPLCLFPVGIHADAANSSNIQDNLKVELVGGSNPYSDAAEANPGDEVAFRVFFANRGSTMGAHPRITVTLDPRLTYVPESTIFYSKENGTNVQYKPGDKKIALKGQTITFAWFPMPPSGESAVAATFKARVKPAKSLSE